MRALLPGLLLVASLAGPARADWDNERPPPPAMDETLEEASSPRGPDDIQREWPEALIVQLAAVSARLDFGGASFDDPNGPLQTRGESLSLAPADALGFELGVGYVGELLGVTVGLSYANPVGTRGARVEALGPTAEGRRIHLTRWFAELGLQRRFGDVTPFLALHAGLQRAIVDLVGTRSGDGTSLSARRATLGPRVGVRAWVFRKLYLHGSFFVDLLTPPDHVITLGLGVGER